MKKMYLVRKIKNGKQIMSFKTDNKKRVEAIKEAHAGHYGIKIYVNIIYVEEC